MSPDTALTVRTRRDLILATNNRVDSQVHRPKPARQPRAECVTGYSDSPLAVSPTTGRVASGPWQGPYGSSMGSAGSSPIYLDSKGSGHFSLETNGPESPTTPVASMSM